MQSNSATELNPCTMAISDDVDNELLSLFMIASGEDELLPWTPTAPPSTACRARLARKAELARASRLRKKNYISDLEQKVQRMKEAVQEAQDRIRKAPNVTKGPQRSAVRYLERAISCTRPGRQVRFTIWGLDQPAEFYGRPGLWQNLMLNEIGLDRDRLDGLRNCQMRIRQQRQVMARAEQLAKIVAEECRRVTDKVNSETAQFLSIFNHEQKLALQHWVAENDFTIDIGNDRRASL
uniref:BZIP domain-containing protein n=1 Tax=Spongospora subterranea TaxID=70186 RepID=A0A0H5RPJ9_9EUKA|eukprot:CRZ10649.1 hypothetical protein [Spongospora subterranea]